jgi:uncharacterized membrane protein
MLCILERSGGSVGSTYDWLKFLHITAAMVAVAPAVAYPLMFLQVEKGRGEALRRVAAFAARNDTRIFGPALIVTGLFGLLLVTDMDHVEFGHSWVSAALLLWIIMNGVLHGLLLPAERKVAAGDESAQRLVQIGGSAMILLYLSMVHLMVFRPGVDY